MSQVPSSSCIANRVLPLSTGLAVENAGTPTVRPEVVGCGRRPGLSLSLRGGLPRRLAHTVRVGRRPVLDDDRSMCGRAATRADLPAGLLDAGRHQHPALCTAGQSECSGEETMAMMWSRGQGESNGH